MTPEQQAKTLELIAARKEAETIVELIVEAATRIAKGSKEASRHFLKTIDDTVHAALEPTEKPATTPARQATRPVVAVPPDATEALDIVEEMGELALEVPDAGQDYASDVLEKAQSIGRTIERANSVTGPQF